MNQNIFWFEIPMGNPLMNESKEKKERSRTSEEKKKKKTLHTKNKEK